jgi:UPF0042 nucleotide-binding protein
VSGDEAATEREEFVVVTGLSGSGKSLAHRCLEDMGWFCIDNLPTDLIPKLSDMKALGGPGLNRLCLTVDVRGSKFADQFPEQLTQLRARHERVQVLFLEAGDAALLRRFSETRRRHPLAGDRPLSEGISTERELLAAVRDDADTVLDTSEWSGQDLRDELWKRFGDGEGAAADRLTVGIVSFGYRHGVPPHADLVFDVRFIPNPYYVPHLRPLSGRDAPIQDFLEGRPEYAEFQEHLYRLLDFLLPAYRREGKSYLTIAIGCTGGRHRSVAVSEALQAHLAEKRVAASLTHRDCDRHHH